jgi:hypothetical protein
MATTNGGFSVAAGVALPNGQVTYPTETAKTAAYQVLTTDAGTLFTTTGNTGSLTFTLPAIAANLGPFEFLNTVAQTMVISSTEGSNIVTDGNAAASHLTFSTSSHQIGARIVLRSNAAGTLWYTENKGNPGNTLTVS